jgi:hypothetical protein
VGTGAADFSALTHTAFAYFPLKPINPAFSGTDITVREPVVSLLNPPLKLTGFK